MDIITISGKAGSGKSTLANLLNNNLEKSCISKFAYPIYSTYDKMQSHIPFKYLNKSTSKNRKLLISIADMYKSEYGEKVFAEILRDRIKYTDEGYKRIMIIDDLRYLYEIETLKEIGSIHNIFKVRLEASAELRRNRVSAPADEAHPSETALDNYPHFDMKINVDNMNADEVLEDVLYGFNHNKKQGEIC